MTSWKTYKLGDVVNILDNRRIPLSAREREQRHGEYPYYGAQGISIMLMTIYLTVHIC